MPGRNRQPRPPPHGHQHQHLPSSSSTTRPQIQTQNPHPNPRGNPPRRNAPPVPPHASLLPSTPVSLILKPDQPTGRQVTGIVAHTLTRGDHPRGVKVRLRDGRVGRVQRIVSEAEGLEGERGAGMGMSGDGQGSAGVGSGRGGRGRGRGGWRHESDIRESDPYLWDEGHASTSARQDGGLFAQLEEADRQYEGERLGGMGMGKAKTEIVVCPVCGVFEGDERAVGAHVGGHFGEG